jgi:hypothetical protein
MPLKLPFRIQPVDLAVAAGLLLPVLAVFAQAISFQFLTWDDPSYVTDNTQENSMAALAPPTAMYFMNSCGSRRKNAATARMSR